MQTPCVQTPVSCFLWTFTLLQKGEPVPWDRPGFGCHHQCLPLGLSLPLQHPKGLEILLSSSANMSTVPQVNQTADKQ